MPSKKTSAPKRIPIGTTVKFSTQPGYYPERTGVVTDFNPARGGIYTVRVETTPTGRPMAKPCFMHPYACRLEAQNPKALKKV